MQDSKGLKTGTTTVGVRIKDAVVLGADMRASMGHIAYDEESKKIYKITEHLAVTNAGSVGDSLTILRFLTSQAKLYEMERETPFTSKAAVTLLSNIFNANRYYPFVAQFIIAGFNGQSDMYEVEPFGGILERTKYAANGSGTEFALNTFDLGYKEDMNEEEAIALAARAVEAGRKRDIYSGGKGISIAVVDASGVRFLEDGEPSAEKSGNAQKKVKK